MAFVRWRGNCAELLTTIYQNGKSRQILLAQLPQDYASDLVRARVAQEHPGIRVDWLAVERALAQGPETKPAPEPPLTILQAENLLRTIAQECKDDLTPRQALDLHGAACVLTELRADPRLAAICWRCAQSPSAGSTQRTNLSSDDTCPGARANQGRATRA